MTIRPRISSQLNFISPPVISKAIMKSKTAMVLFTSITPSH